MNKSQTYNLNDIFRYFTRKEFHNTAPIHTHHNCKLVFTKHRYKQGKPKLSSGELF